jgi:hypothetical protein
MNTARFSQFHDVWGNKWSFCSEEKETGTTISSLILYWVPSPYEIDKGTLCLLQTRLFHSARWSGWNHLLVTLRLVCSTIMVKFYEKLWLLKKNHKLLTSQIFVTDCTKKGLASMIILCPAHYCIVSSML